MMEKPSESFGEGGTSALLGLGEVWRSHHLIAVFILRDLRVRYKQTFLGVVWTFLQPMMTALLFAMIFGQWMGVPSGGLPYVAMLLSGISVWMFFAGAIQHATSSLVANSSLVTKIYFPRAVLPIASVGLHALDFFVGFFLLCAALFYYKVPLSINMPWILVALVALCALTIGVSLITSAFSVYFRDFSNLVPIVLQLLMFASPVVYPSTIVPVEYSQWVALNPLVGIIDLVRWSIFEGQPFPTHFYTKSFPLSTIVLIFGWLIFNRLEGRFSDEI